MARRAVRELQQLLTEPRPEQQETTRLHHRKGGGAFSTRKAAIATATAVSAEDGCLLCCYRTFRGPLSLVLALLIILFAAIILIPYNTNGTAAADYVYVRNVKESRERNNPIENTIIEPSNHELSIQQSTLSHLNTLPSFPKIVHLIWPDKQILSKDFEILNYGAKQLRRLNPDWNFIVHDYDSIDDTIRNFRHPRVPKSMNDDLKNAHIVEKTDAFRLMIVYEMGGLYVDIDRVMNVRLNEIIDASTVKLVVATYYDINFTNDLFGSAPGNKLVLNAFQKQCEEREGYERSKNGWIKSTDQMNLVNTYTKSIEYDLFHRHFVKYDEKTWDEARHVLSSHSGGMVVTYKDVWCDGLLVKDFNGCKGISRDPMYDAYGVIPWDEQVDEVWREEEKEEEP